MRALSSRVGNVVTLGLVLATAEPPFAQAAAPFEPLVEARTPSPPVPTPVDAADGSWREGRVVVFR